MRRLSASPRPFRDAGARRGRNAPGPIPGPPVHSRSKFELGCEVDGVACGFFGMTSYQLLLNWGEVYVPAGTSSIIVAAAPLVSVVVARFLFGEKITPITAVGSVIALAGVAFVCLARATGRGGGRRGHGPPWRPVVPAPPVTPPPALPRWPRSPEEVTEAGPVSAQQPA